MEKRNTTSQIIQWVPHFLVVACALMASCFAGDAGVEDDPFAGVHTNASVTRSHGSYDQLNAELAKVEELRRELGASAYHNRPHWVPGYGLPALKMLGGGLTAAAVSQAIAQGFKKANSTTNPVYDDNGMLVSNEVVEGVLEPSDHIAAVILGTLGTVGVYKLARLIARKLYLERRKRQRMEQFIALWPGYRSLATDDVKVLMESAYDEFANSGDSTASIAQGNKLYDLVAHMLIAKRNQIRREINAMRQQERAARRGGS